MAITNALGLELPQEDDNLENGLIDTKMLQELQDQFCYSNNLYVVCLGQKEGVITKAYGTKEELEYVHSLVNESVYMQLVSKIENEQIETMVEYPATQDFVKVCAISTRIEGKTQVIWVIVGLLEEKITSQNSLPEGMMTTTETHYYASVEFLSLLSAQLFEVKINQLIAQTAMKKSQNSENAMQHQLQRLRTMTEVIQMLESDDAFADLVENVIKETCECLQLTGGFLIRENIETLLIEGVCEYVTEEKASVLWKLSNCKRADLPFFDGKPYVISTDAMMPDEFETLMKDCKMTAAVFQPIEAGGQVVMYLGFYEHDRNRTWEMDDIKFINDVKRVVQSVLVKRISKNSLASSYASLESILENTGSGIYVSDTKNRTLLYTNKKFKDFFAKTIAAGKLDDLIFSEQEIGRRQYFEEIYSVEEERWLDVYKTEIDWVDGRKVSLCTLYDITDKKIYQKEIEEQANNDFLTGLFNRMRCEQDLKKYVMKAQNAHQKGALLYLDLDDFKHINDGLGHQYGDVLLKAISRSLQRVGGVTNTCYRMGGDEFIVIVPGKLFDKLDSIIEEITSIFTKPWFLKGEDYYCTMSMGIAYFPTDGTTVDELIRKSDMALMRAKRRGKNRIEYYNNDTDADSASHRLDLEKNMRTAAMNECSEFEVYYQPIIDTKDQKNVCCGAEALVRWNSSVMGFVSPNDFIPLAEYLGLINPIGEYVLRQAVKRCKYWNDMGHPDYKVNVNLSVVQLLQNDIVKKIKSAIEDSHINPANLTLEVTESLAINDMVRMKKILSEIKSLGVKVALDDFGTGYSSLNHIREMPIDVIKIDRCFIEHLGEDDFSNAFVKMVAELASAIGVHVCVEGVETDQQLDVVQQMNIGMIQGYYFGKPMQIGEFEQKYL